MSDKVNNISKYLDIDKEEIEEDKKFRFLKKPNYGDYMRICIKNVILIYNLQIDHKVIKDHIERILVRRDNTCQDKAIYNSSLNKTYVYIEFCNKYQTKRYTFDIKIDDRDIIPHIRTFNTNKISLILNSIFPSYKNTSNTDQIQNIYSTITDNSYFTKQMEDKIDKIEGKIDKIDEIEGKMNKINKIDEIEEKMNKIDKIDEIEEKVSRYEKIINDLMVEINSLKNKKKVHVPQIKEKPKPPSITNKVFGPPRYVTNTTVFEPVSHL